MNNQKLVINKKKATNLGEGLVIVKIKKLQINTKKKTKKNKLLNQGKG